MEEILKKIKKIIDESQSISLFSSTEREKDSFPATLALFYGLKKIGKNVNLINGFPKKYNFLIKRGMFRFSKADFLISIRGKNLNLSHLFYEKTNDRLNLYLKTNNGNLKQEDIYFNSLNSKNILITIGIGKFGEIKKNLPKETSDFIININNQSEGQDFGQIKLIDENYSSLSEIVFDVLKTIDEELFSEDTINSLLAGIIQGSSGFQDNRLNSETFKKISFLIERGASFQEITSNLYQEKERNSICIFQRILNKINFSSEQNIGWLIIAPNDFKQTNSSPLDLPFTLERLSSPMFPFRDFFCIWQNSSPSDLVRGIFYSPNENLLEKVKNNFQGDEKGNGFLFRTLEKSPEKVKDELMRIITS